MTGSEFVLHHYHRIKSRTAAKILVCIALCSFALSFALYLFFYPGTRKIMLFESLDKGSVYAEPLFIPRQNIKDACEYFIGELLLGPKSERYRPLFAKGTRLLSFMTGKDGALYINLSDKALFREGTSSQTERACILLEQNIRKNYNSADNIVIAIAGHKVYEYND